MAAELLIRAVTDMAGAKGDIKGLGDAVNQLAAPAAVAAGALAVMAYDIVGAASDGEQAAGALAAVFGDATAAMTRNAEGAATSVGLAESEYSQMAAVMGAQLSNMGIAQDEVAGTTDGLISKGADLAAQFGGSTSEAVEALSSLMRGERDPIEKYGVSISAAAVEAQKAEMGLSGLTGEADRAATTQATLALLNEQTASSTGAFARETNTAAGAAQIANATWENTKATLGEKLLPAVTSITQGLTGLATWVGNNSTVVLVLGGVVGVLAGAILLANGAMMAARSAIAVATIAQWAWNVAMSANPLGLIVLGIAAVVAAIVFLVMNWDKVKAVALAVWRAISDAASKAGRWVQDKFNAALQAVAGFFGRLGDKAAQIAGAISNRVSSAATSVRNGFNNAIQAVVGFFSNLGNKAAGIGTAIASAFSRAGTGVKNAISGAVNAATTFFSNLGNAASRVVDRILGFFRGIPGKVMGFFNRISIPGWISDALGFLGLSAPANEVTTAAMPGLATFSSGSPWSTPTSRGVSTTSLAGAGGPGVVIQVNGALDPVGVARQIRDILNTDARRRGTVGLGGKVIA